ncbi:MAG: hypothetical protein QW757_05195, partial [Candidatus Woesearchaeota archaeon]
MSFGLIIEGFILTIVGTIFGFKAFERAGWVIVLLSIASFYIFDFTEDLFSQNLPEPIFVFKFASITLNTILAIYY